MSGRGGGKGVVAVSDWRRGTGKFHNRTHNHAFVETKKIKAYFGMFLVLSFNFLLLFF